MAPPTPWCSMAQRGFRLGAQGFFCFSLINVLPNPRRSTSGSVLAPSTTYSRTMSHHYAPLQLSNGRTNPAVYASSCLLDVVQRLTTTSYFVGKHDPTRQILILFPKIDRLRRSVDDDFWLDGVHWFVYNIFCGYKVLFIAPYVNLKRRWCRRASS